MITFLLVAFGAFWLTPSWSEAGPSYFLLFFAIFVMLIAGQLFWVGRVVGLGERFIPGKPRRAWLTAREWCLSVLLRVQPRPLHRPLGYPAGRFDPFDAAPCSV